MAWEDMEVFLKECKRKQNGYMVCEAIQNGVHIFSKFWMKTLIFQGLLCEPGWQYSVAYFFSI